VAVSYCRMDYNELCKMDGMVGMGLAGPEIKANYKLLLRSCVGMSLGVMALQNAIKKGEVERLDVSIDREKYHPFFPVPVITMKKSA
jgi:N-alpha-acetyltransferase 35, NatC auxiliary subunit